MSEAQVSEDRSPKAVIRNYLLENEPVFARLYNLQQEVRASGAPTLQYIDMMLSVNSGVEPRVR